jgi:hypothetical protein
VSVAVPGVSATEEAGVSRAEDAGDVGMDAASLKYRHGLPGVSEAAEVVDNAEPGVTAAAFNRLEVTPDVAPDVAPGVERLDPDGEPADPVSDPEADSFDPEADPGADPPALRVESVLLWVRSARSMLLATA